MGNNREQRTQAGKPLYIETHIKASMERVWELSQNPQQHPRWDLRFSRIVPIAEDEQGQLRFRYEFRLPLHTIRGTGTSLGNRQRADGQASSVLKFTTSDPLSPIGPSAGYWRYIPTDHGVRFITEYNYVPGMGLVGKLLDTSVIRPALGWATGLSFDRMRLWAESDVDPAVSRNRWFIDVGSRAAGALTGFGLLRRAQSTRHPLLTTMGMAAIAFSLFVKPHDGVPQARRCLRRAPDARSARVPSALADLRAPDQVVSATGDQEDWT